MSSTLSATNFSSIKHETAAEHEMEHHRATLKAFRSLYVDETKHETRRTNIAPPSSFPLPPTPARLLSTTTTTTRNLNTYRQSLPTNQFVSHEVNVAPPLSESFHLQRMREWLRDATKNT
jgi:hypothetical protein